MPHKHIVWCNHDHHVPAEPGDDAEPCRSDLVEVGPAGAYLRYSPAGAMVVLLQLPTGAVLTLSQAAGFGRRLCRLVARARRV